MTSIASTLGVGSGVDTDALVTKLVTAAYTPKSDALKTKEDLNTAQISAIATVQNGIDSFASALSSLVSGGTLRAQPTSSNESILTATAQPGSRIGDLSAQLEVRQLAQAQSLVSGYLSGPTAAVGTGGLTLTTAAGSFAITIDSTNNSLTGLAQAINASGAGLTASVVQDATGARLAIKGASGAANAFSLTPAASNTDTGLAQFQYDSTQHTMTQAQAAQDAIVAMDGVQVTRASNSISDLVAGVTLQLQSASVGTSVSLGVSHPTDAISQAVSDFVSAYNTLKAQLDPLTAAASGTTAAGPLHNDVGTKQMQRQLAALTSTVLNTSGGPSTLAEIGVSTNRDGTLSLDTDKLSSMLASDPTGVEALFDPSQHSDSPLIQITSAIGQTTPGTYQLTNITAQTGSSNAEGTIAGVTGITTGANIFASITSAASGLVIHPLGDVASATVTVDAGLGGILQALRDALRATGGPLANSLNSYNQQKSTLADQREKLTDAQTAYTDKLTDQFSKMDARVAAYKQTQAFMTQQIDAWNSKDA